MSTTVSYVVIVFSLSKLIQHIGFRVWYADVGIPPNSSHANASLSQAGLELAELALERQRSHTESPAPRAYIIS